MPQHSSPISFATTNRAKLAEALTIFGAITPLDIAIPEIQAVDVESVVRAKLEHVLDRSPRGPILVEDTGLYVGKWNGLPGALIKWFVEGMSTAALADTILNGQTKTSAIARSVVGVAFQGAIALWAGETTGHIVVPRGEELGWNSLFEESTTGFTFGEMSFSQRLEHSMRRDPLERAKNWIAARSK